MSGKLTTTTPPSVVLAEASARDSGDLLPSDTTLERPSLLDKLPDGVLVVDATGRVQAANAAFLTLLGHPPQAVVGQALQSLLAEDDVLHLLGVDSLLQEDAVHESSVIFATADGAPRALLVSFVRAAGERDTLLVAREPGVIRAELQDASRWMASEQERSQELREARDALELKNAALLTTQAELQQAHTKLQGEMAARERLEHELRLAQKLEAVGQLAAGLAHEINTPLQYIGDNVTFLSSVVGQLSEFATTACGLPERVSASPELRTLLELAATQADLEFALTEAPKALVSLVSGVDQVSKIVRAMKSFASADQAEQGRVDLNQALLDTLVVAHGEYRNVACVETELSELPLVACFPGAINQVFLSLITNAAHAIADRGRAGLGTIRVRTRRVGQLVEVSVEDDGCGIPEAIRHRVFDPFFTTKQVGRGAGQGLSTARRVVVEGHGGTLTFDSVVGKGTTFVVRLPISGSAPTS